MHLLRCTAIGRAIFYQKRTMTCTDQIPALSKALDGPCLLGFVTDIEADALPPDLDEQTVPVVWQEQVRQRVILTSNRCSVGACCINKGDIS